MTARYTMDQISAFLYDAINDEQIGANQIYESIIDTVAEQTEYLQLQYQKSQKLFDLLKALLNLMRHPGLSLLRIIRTGFYQRKEKATFQK